MGSNVDLHRRRARQPAADICLAVNNTPINNATNASLTIPNVQLTNAGKYSVVVTDLTGGIVTSSPPAILTVLPPAPVASFTASPTNGAAPLERELHRHLVRFGHGLGVGVWRWQHVDQSEPVGHLRDPGTYTVQEIVSGPGGSSTDTWRT